MPTNVPFTYRLPAQAGRVLTRDVYQTLEISCRRGDRVQICQRVRLWVGLAAFSLLVLICVAAWHDFAVPDNDSLEYLAYARSLHVASVYAATEAGPSADAGPGREPGYSLFVAGLAKLHPSWSAALRDCSPPAPDCASGLVFLKYANAVLLALAAVIAGAIAYLLGGSRLAAVTATVYVAGNFMMWRHLKYAISDFLAVFLAAVTVLSLVLTLRRRTNPLAWLGFGLALALLGLVKQVFVPFAILFAVGLLVHGALSGTLNWRCFVPGLSVLLVVAVINGGWLLRNVAYFGVTSDSRGAIALSTREVFDDMTAAEHAVAFVWFTRCGHAIAKRFLPESYWHRFDLMAPDGFYLQGQVVNHNARVGRLKSEGLSDAQAQSRASAVVVREILDNWTGYLASMPALFYRGLWFDAFMPLPLFVLPFVWAWRELRWILPVALSPALWSLLIYPAISLNIDRYQFPVVVALGVTAGLAADRLLRERTARQVDEPSADSVSPT
jgi:hypothetical protein